MQEFNLNSKFKDYSSKLMKLLKLDKIDHHQSLTFLHKNYGVHPSEVITILVVFIALLILILDGFNVISSILCFLLPMVRCLGQMGAQEAKSPLNFVRLNTSQQNSRLTDEQFSQILSNNQRQFSTVKIYTVYFILYGVLEVLSPIMVWAIGSFSWLIVKCLFAWGMLSKKVNGASRLLSMMKVENGQLEGEPLNFLRKKADQFKRL